MNRTPFTFRFDGRTIAAEPGQSIAAALIADGQRSWRRTREGGRPRGMFCGIGVCFDCLVTVNGRPNHRACLVEAAPGDVVETQEGAGRGHLAC
ncbi:sarcosine oxidase, alpha subunit [Streptomyces himastatinicus ATCC 53653]|uniref:Sarcosine oxidase, alpha subunit n=1 Tax=Streptomyces himastatinicus ATCC 53653 TaxID=457427 RepID=D9WV19_9ACTN|nr:(2Fe-2S)-binding protein [Streptomyces himastatinicus]EFL28519.1 sarcosine oxidase, alpha subunit [Streptomyces himastatinicus ATCC 53653]